MAEAEGRRSKGKAGGIVVYGLLALLIVGLAGFSAGNFGGTITRIGRVGDRPIRAEDYARALNEELQAFQARIGQPLPFAQAQALGLDRQVRERLILTAALDNEAARLGLSVGDARVAQEITAMPAFQGVSGSFDRETYRLTLERNDLTEAEFESRVRDDVARALLQGAVASGFDAPQPMVDRLLAWIAEERAFTLVALSEADLPAPLPAPDAAALRAYYDENPDAFTAPELRRITYAAALPADVAPAMAVDETALRALYDERIGEFVIPERRLVERLVFATEAEAQAARARLDAGESFETLVAERGLTLADTDLGDVTQAELGAAGAAVFALAEPGVVGPLPSDLGPALFRMNGVLAAQETTFDQAREALSEEARLDAARRDIAGRIEALDDLLAGGASLEDLATEAGLTLGRLDYAPGVDHPMAGYTAFREAAEAMAEGDFPELIELDDGGLVALRLDEIVPPALRPFDSVMDQVAEGARAAALTRALTARAEEAAAAIAAGAQPGAWGIAQVVPAMTRDGFLDGAPAAVIETVFAMQPGQTRVVAEGGFVGVVRLDAVIPADPASDQGQALAAALRAEIARALAQDAGQAFAAAKMAEAGIRLDDAAIAAVNAQFR